MILSLKEKLEGTAMRKILVIEQKSFELFNDFAGKSAVVTIIERGRDLTERIRVKRSSIRWICECWRLAVRWLEIEKFIRTKDEGDIVLVIQRSNQRGSFVQVSMNPPKAAGVIGLLLPEECKGVCWQKLASVLETHFVAPQKPSNVPSFSKNHREFLTIQTGLGAKGSAIGFNKSAEERESFTKWAMAICIKRINPTLSWSDIANSVGKFLRIEEPIKIIPLVVDRGILRQIVGGNQLGRLFRFQSD